MVNTSEKSTILLLCLGLDSDKTEIKKVGVKQLKEIFDEFGHLKKVIIFTRKILLKAFLEYDSLKSAEMAKDKIHETFVKNYGKARLYFSPMECLKFSNKYLEFWEDTAEEKHIEDDAQTKYSLRPSDSISSNKASSKHHALKLNTSKNDSFRGYQLFSNSVDSLDSNLNRDSFLSNQNFVFNSHQNVLNKILLNIKETDNNSVETLPSHSLSDSNEEETVAVSKVILVSNLGHVFKNSEEIFNLFSAFGNISTILFMVNLQKALVEYTEIKYASETITNLNNLVLGETKMHINYSKYKKIDLQKNNKNENSMQFNQVLIVPPQRNRYRSNSQNSIIRLSSTLLISFPKIGSVTPIDVYNSIIKVSKPVKTKLISSKAVLGKNEVVNMLFSFENTESAAYVMYKCHNSIVQGALLDIFFF